MGYKDFQRIICNFIALYFIKSNYLDKKLFIIHCWGKIEPWLKISEKKNANAQFLILYIN